MAGSRETFAKLDGQTDGGRTDRTDGRTDSGERADGQTDGRIDMSRIARDIRQIWCVKRKRYGAFVKFGIRSGKSHETFVKFGI